MTYLEMVNEVLVRMREDEITSVNDEHNDPQQKIVCRFVNDARRFVDKSHTWNAQRKIWLVDLGFDVAGYPIPDSNESASIYTVRWAGTSNCLKEANERWISRQKKQIGTPQYYAPSFSENNELTVRFWPVPGEEYVGSTADVSEYAASEYTEAEYNGEPAGVQTILMEGYKVSAPMKNDDDLIRLPIDPVMYYALAYSSRERGEVGGQTSGELFALAKQYLSDAISWDVSNSELEYVWSTR